MIMEKKPKYYLNPKGEFVIENYNVAKPFANFFPGIAGKYGIPMWVFYVNRGQAIASFGTKDKDNSILEFFPANKSWQMASVTGFRTFIKLNSGKETLFYEPFQNGFSSLKFNILNSMKISPHGLIIEETNLSLGIKIEVEYFNIPSDNYAGLTRIVTINNLGPKNKKLQLLDGLPQIVPFGTNNFFLKKMNRTIEAWMNVENLDKNIPFYKLAVDPTDGPEVIHLDGGNFYLSFLHGKERLKIIKPIVDPERIFGPYTDFALPQRFLTNKNFQYPKEQLTKNKTPCGFSLLNLTLSPGKAETLYSIIGYMRNLETLNSSISKITAFGYLSRKSEENKKIIQDLCLDISTCSSSKEFDLYAKQTYLDNIIRGGYPVIFKSDDFDPTFYLYSRKHGDLERDYNKFFIQPTYFSQGNGNYRDINQNRRCDIWFNPEVKDENLIYFFNLIQADGFNPLIVKGASFKFSDTSKLNSILKETVEDKYVKDLSLFLDKPFTPGDLILYIEDNKIKLLPKADPPAAEKLSYDEFLAVMISNSTKIQEAEPGEGFWTDHWVYNMDLLESYLQVYPEKYKEIIFDKKIFTYFDNFEIVRPRCEKYVLHDGKPKQLHSVALDSAKKEMIKKRAYLPHAARTQYGQGQVYQTNLMNKLLCLLVNKLASLDPFGVGIEMEANKPNWFDALNGLPALFGSSLCETFELKRLVILLKDVLEKIKIDKIQVANEIAYFISGLDNLILGCLKDNSTQKDYNYWDKSYSLKEDYREKTRFGFSGEESEIDSQNLKRFLNNALEKINAGIEKAFDLKKNVYYSYFINEVTDYELINRGFVKPNKFLQKRLPLFLEGQMHALRLAEDLNSAKVLHKATKSSELFDKKLKMYKVTAPLSTMPEEIGRCRVFTPGWLENESIWLHMEYKYLLELLKCGLYSEFYQDFKNVLIPFQKPQDYGRSILENSSFLVSSAFPDKKLHGNGFVARLSGSTAEFLQIWLIMNLGNKPFFLNEKNELNLKFSPVLAGWLFNKKGDYCFNFLGNIPVTYHNPMRTNTFGNNPAKPAKIILKDNHDNTFEFTSDTIPSPYAEQIRSRLVEYIDIFLK